MTDPDKTLPADLANVPDDQTRPTEPVRRDLDQTAATLAPDLQATVASGSRDLQATMVAGDRGAEAATIVAAGSPADAATIAQAPGGGQATLVGAGSDATRATVVSGQGGGTALPQTAGASTGGLTRNGLGGTLNRTGTLARTGRTRMNVALPADTQQLDVKLQLSRTSVLSDLVSTRAQVGTAPVPKGLSKLAETQGTDGRYAIDRPLAAGGMGAVLQIKDNDFHRPAAMKVIHGKYANSGEALERFLAEAQVTAQLEHPNIVPIHDLGVLEDGTLYFTMKLIEGMSVGKVVKLLQQQAGILYEDKTKENPKGVFVPPDEASAKAAAEWSIERRLLMFLKILDGVGFAHSKGVVHRDIKPDNVMLGGHGEVLVVDWGIAKVLKDADADSELVRQVASIRDHESLSATMEGSAMGTIFYMPPEQAKGELSEIDGRSDIYALGAMLYELLALKRCLEPSTIPAMVMKITTGDFIPLDAAAPGLHPDLVAIVHKAMALDRAKRYPSCAAMAEDVTRFLNGQAVLARQRNLIERIGLWYGRHKTKVLAGAGAAGLAVVVAGGTTWVVQAQARAAADSAKAAAVAAWGERQGKPLERLEEIEKAILTAAALAPADGDLAELRAQAKALVATERDRLEEERERAAQAEAAKKKAAVLAAEAADLERAGELAKADEKLSAALELQPADKALDAARERIRTVLRDRAEAAAVAEAGRQREAADRAAAEAAALLAQPGADLDRVLALARNAEQAYAKAERIPGTQEQAKVLDRLRAQVERTKSESAARTEAEAALAQAGTLAQADAPDWDKVLATANQALGRAPAGDADLRTRIVRERDRWIQASVLAAANRERAQRLALSRQAGQRAEGALAAGDLDQAQTAIAQAIGHSPDDDADGRAALVALRDRIRAAAAERAAAQARADRVAKAEVRLATARARRAAVDQSRADHVAARSKEAALEAKLRGMPAEAKADLFAARTASQQAEAALVQAWGDAEAEGQAVLGLLPDDPAHATVAAARALLAELYLIRLRAARADGRPAEIRAYGNLVRRYDDAGRWASEFAGQGAIAVSGAAVPVEARRLVADAGGRLQPAGGILAIAPGQPALVEAGSWQLRLGDTTLAVAVPINATAAVAWPGAAPVVAGHRLRWVPAESGGGFWLGESEVTVAQYAAFLKDPAVFKEVARSWKRAFTNEAVRADGSVEPTIRIPRLAPGANSAALVRWQLVPGEVEAITGVVPGKADPADHPVVGIDRADAAAFCAWLAAQTGRKVRLPSLVELTRAAGGGDSARRWPWGPRFDPAFAVTAWSHAGDEPAAVGSNGSDIGPYGHRDLAGNVREWTMDVPTDPKSGVAGTKAGLVAHGSLSDEQADRFAAGAYESVDPDFTTHIFGFRILVEP
ncbi:MAG: Serine/threonine-protein kinase PknD [Planctomycetota bacterium]|jgi:serine/threonine protein kinase/formylglycine-generating enzyme required for sulfatase activity